MHTRHHHHSTTFVPRLGWAGVAAAVAATVTLGAGVAGAEQGRTGPARATQRGPVEATVVADDGAVLAAYLGCLSDVGGSADTMERWSDACHDLAVTEATIAALEAHCLAGGGRSADTTEARVDACHTRAVSAAGD